MSIHRAAPAALVPVLRALATLLVLLAPASALAQPPTETAPTETAPTETAPTQPSADTSAPTVPPPDVSPKRESNCSDGADDDGDTVFDCGDHDCHADPVCQPDGKPEVGEARCGDWVDNDEDGFTDCDDVECDGTSACMGSWDRELKGEQVGGPTSTVGTGTAGRTLDLQPGQVPEDLLFTAGDKDGERDNYTCNDGFDNDNDGFVDCDDIGCKLSDDAQICQPSGNIRFSVVARVAQTVNLAGPEFGTRAPINQPGGDDPTDPRTAERRTLLNTEFETLQLRVLGQLPFIQNSFFLISARAERTPRVTFATFQVPLGKGGHYFNINSGGGGLSLELVRSVHKRMMVDPAYYVYNAFEQGNGAALEFGGPLTKNGKFLYRTFIAGGSGRYAGNVGGTFFPDGDRNFTWSAGAQIHMNLVGYYNRFDSPMLYVPVPTTFTLSVGAKYDQRAQERYPAANIQSVFRWKRLILLGEVYGKRELNFKNWQIAFNVQAGVLAVKRRLMFAADFGQYLATPFEDPPADLGSDLRRQLTELQWRVVAHVYLWRDVLVLSAVFRDRFVERPPSSQIPEGTDRRTDLRFLLMYRF